MESRYRVLPAVTAASPPRKPPWYEEFMIAGLSAVGAICFTNPVDVVKTRMTLQQSAGAAQPYPNVATALIRIGREGGLAGLQRGLGPSCFWQFSNVSVRFGVYAAAKQQTGVSEAQSPFAKWVASLGLAGVLSIAVAETVFWVLSFPTSECAIKKEAAAPN